jgi:hypothetical protein
MAALKFWKSAQEAVNAAVAAEQRAEDYEAMMDRTNEHNRIIADAEERIRNAELRIAMAQDKAAKDAWSKF